MTAVNQEDLLGEIIPDVFISQILLESSGTPVVDNNPHISVSGENKVNIQTNNDNLLVTLKIILKEKLSNDLLGNWLDKLDLQKYLRVKIFQSTDPKTTALLSLSQDMLDLVDPEKRIDFTDIRFKMAGTVFETDNINIVHSKLQDTIQIKTFNIEKKNLGSTVIDDDGNETFNVNYTVTFQGRNSFPDHLAYFVISSFDVQKLAQDYHLEYDTVSLDKMNGKVVSDVVIDDGDLVDRSYVFYDPDNKVWSGGIHLTPTGQWRSKSQEEEGSVNLRRDTVTNNKIQDFRNVKDIEKLEFDFSGINAKLGEIEIKQTSNDKIEPLRLENYFSDFNLASDRNGDSKFVFSINYEKMIMDLSLYGRLIKKAGSRFIQEMMTETQIKQMRIIRRRVTNDTNVNRFSIIEGSKKFDENEPDEIICVSGEKNFNKFVTVNQINGSLREVKIVLDSTQPALRHFTGMDKTMSEVTDGFYQYGVEIDIDDGSVEFLKKKVSDLEDAKAELFAYYNEASKLSLTKFVEVQNPHIKHAPITNTTPDKLVGNFDFDSNRFTQKFINQMTSKYSGRNLRAAPWIAPIVIYADVLDMFTDAFQSRRDRSVVLNSLFTYTSPRTGNPAGISAVLRLMDSLISTIQSIVGTSETKSPKKSYMSTINTSNLFSGRNTKRTIKVHKFFKNIFDSNMVKGVSLDYLSNGHDDTKNEDGLKKISGDDFIRRINSETLRFFKDTEPDINITTPDNQISIKDKISNTNFSFLAPSRIDFPRKSVSLLDHADIPNVQSKKKRVLENINDGDDLRKDKFAHIHTTMMAQNLTRHPIASLHDRFGKLKPNDNTSQNAIEEIMDAVLSEHGSVLINPIPLNAESNIDGTFLLQEEEKLLLRQGKNFGSLPDVLKNRNALTQNDKKFDELDNGGKNLFAHSITQGLVKNGTKNKKRTDLKKPNIRTSTQTFSKNSKDFDLLAALNPKKLTVVSQQNETEQKVIAGFKRPLTEDAIKQLPNHFKAVMLFNQSNGAIKFDKLGGLVAGNIVDKLQNGPENKFGFEMLKKIERLIGFVESKNGTIMMKKPVWKMLTQKDYDSLSGEEILCRLIKYENSDLGISRNQGIDSPNYDDYFILIPRAVRKPVPKLTPPTPISNTELIEKIRLTLTDNFPGLQLADRDRKRTNGDLLIANLGSKFTLVDTTQQVEITSRDDKRKVKIKNKNIDVPTDIAVEALTMDCQSSIIPQEHLNSNVIGIKKFNDILAHPKVLKAISDKQLLAIQELDEIDNDKCSAFGKFRPNGQFCKDKK